MTCEGRITIIEIKSVRMEYQSCVVILPKNSGYKVCNSFIEHK